MRPIDVVRLIELRGANDLGGNVMPSVQHVQMHVCGNERLIDLNA
jgi:hypothetical protein